MPNGQARLLTDEGLMLTTELPASGSATVRWQTTPSLATYVRPEVRHSGSDPTTGLPGPMAAMTNPIFLGHK